MLATCYPNQVLVPAFQHCCAVNKLVDALVGEYFCLHETLPVLWAEKRHSEG